MCFVNWTGSANAMESDIIFEGFKCSEKLYGVRYKWFVGDGDSSTYKRILCESPYDNCVVQKIECSNHLLRNFCYSLEEIAKKGDNKRNLVKGKTKGLRLNIQSKIMKMRVAVVKACQHWHKSDLPISQRVFQLKRDILNCPRHTFGDHTKCAAYFCNGKRKPFESNLVRTLQNVGLWSELMVLFDKLSGHSRSLLHCMNNNAVENLNAIIAKFLGGKRKNFTQRGGYSLRVTAATVHKNSGMAMRSLHKQMCSDKSPGKYTKRFEMKMLQRRRRDRIRLCDGGKSKRSKRWARKDTDYGEAIQRVSRTAEDIFRELDEEATRREEIEIATRQQRYVAYWQRLRKFRLTASNFGKVCKRGQILCDALVKYLLYGEFQGNEHTEWGNEKEQKAIDQYSTEHGVAVTKAGLFIDKELHFLAASPDGLIDDGKGLVEVKCPSALSHFTAQEAVKRNADVAFKVGKDGEIVFNKAHNHYYQMQGQMHITGRSYCLYIVWTPKSYICERVPRDDIFWKTNMEEKLTRFYNDCLLPEIVEQNYLVGKPIYNPQYLLEAVAKGKPATRKRKAADCAIVGGQNENQGRVAKTQKCVNIIGPSTKIGHNRGAENTVIGQAGTRTAVGRGSKGGTGGPKGGDHHQPQAAGGAGGQVPRHTVSVDPERSYQPAQCASPVRVDAGDQDSSCSESVDPVGTDLCSPPAPDRWTCRGLGTRAYRSGDGNDLVVATIPGDGSCLFGSIVHQLFGLQPGTEEFKIQNAITRGKIADYIQLNFQSFRDHLVGILGEREPDYDMFLFYSGSGNVVTDPVTAFNTFVTDLRDKPNFFGSGECLLAAAEVFKIKIILHQRRDPCIPVIPDSGEYHAAINIFFHGMDMKHYDSVIEINYFRNFLQL